MKYLLTIFIILLPFVATAQMGPVNPQPQPVKPASAVQPVVPAVVPIDPNREVEDAILFLDQTPEADRIYIRFFTTYAVPPALRNDTVLQLSFVLHSLMGVSVSPEGNAGAYYPLAVSTDDNTITAFNKVNIRNEDAKIAHTSDTLWWIDIRDFNWTPQAWEAVSKEDGYFVEPIVQHDKSTALRLLSGNAIFRADWFIYHATDAQAQLDNKSKATIYDTLLYAQNKNPTTLSEWRAIWGLSIDEAKKFGNESASLVTKSKAVARHNRDVRRYNTHLGYLYETYDVVNQRGRRNYLEAFPDNAGNPPIRDGGEAFATNAVKMQVYTLFGGDEKLVHVADGALARNTNDVLGDSRVIVARSCIDCHAAGPIPSENTIKEYLGSIKFAHKADKLRVDRNYLSEKFEEGVADDQEAFARALAKVNGLKPADNLKKFLGVIDWYNKPVTLEQAAAECGLTKEQYVTEMRKHDKLPGGIALLLQNPSQPIPRDIWESPSVDGIPGMFQQSMIYIHGLTKITYETKQAQSAKLLVDAKVFSGETVIYEAKLGETLPFVDKSVYNNVTWYTVKTPKGNGYLKPEQVVLEAIK